MSYRPTSAQLQELANKTNELLDIAHRYIFRNTVWDKRDYII